jgi:hypothetical protein
MLIRYSHILAFRQNISSFHVELAAARALSPGSLHFRKRDAMKQYFLFLYESPGLAPEISPENMQQIIARYIAWREEVAAKGHMLGGNKLRDGEGRVMRAGEGKVSVTDGPFAEAKEVIGGFFHIQAGSYDQAVEIASTCPHLEFGTIEVREVEPTH